ncbi:GH92 family glycosyl hydrolase [Asticcacaulis benevestitus]|uniref:Alpha-1,2-mannosidase n=1 Tax=Asticcacaulis benevestitus DSM 16100 = ATCC BAA-896 TaxID=1121022 RepID=V4PD52_9CAUL|nr:GH92 family glycosyl hydrolase [Asticcacaulis benevestitus]ESQ91867.1 hypothetical protein ABENE_09545 [Asticcacaulis benevestitus DSM 16100 = ATCC BAA-896]
MISRRQLLATATGVAASLPFRAIAGAKPLRYTTFVDPMIGTGGHGHVYPGASLPFGMVQLSPDTDNARWDASSGYYIEDKSLLGFSHTHLSGTGVGDMMDLLVVPRIGEVTLKPGTLEAPEASYRTRMSHDQETAAPGYYSLTLPDSGIHAELTASARAGLHRYTFPAGQPAYLLLDWQHGAREDVYKRPVVYLAHMERVASDTIVGTRCVDQWAGGRILHFALKVSQPFETLEFFSKDKPVDGERVDGDSLKAVLKYGEGLKAPLMVKVAVSAVDIAGALNNLTNDIPDWDFEGLRQAADRAWETELSRIRVETPHDQDRKIFYTALYHAHMAPTLFSDADGRYQGMDSAVHKLQKGRDNYSTYSLWDTYRAWHPLMTLIAPERAAIFAQNLIDQGAESPYGPVIWPLQGRETHCMIGWHSDSVVAEAIVKGLPGIDVQKAWGLYKELAFKTSTSGLDAYRTQGYIPADQEDQSVSKTIEYCHDDWSMAQIADAAGDKAAASTLRLRSKSYSNVFDTSKQFARPRLKTGAWAEPFDPRGMGHDPKVWWDYTESNSWQATFGVQHDIYSYMALFGGEAGYEAKIDALFNASSDLPSDAPPDMTGLIGQYIHGNEPSHHIAYLYAYTGSHYKTQARVRMLLKSQYRAQPDGLAGNEDCGQMSAWYILSAMGFYPVDPVSCVYVFGSPLFTSVEIPLVNGKTLRILAPKTSESNIYIQSVKWNGKPHTRSWISHAELMSGGVLMFEMGPKPNPKFGADKAERPPSFTVV